jgi:hypothetical protein
MAAATASSRWRCSPAGARRRSARTGWCSAALPAQAAASPAVELVREAVGQRRRHGPRKGAQQDAVQQVDAVGDLGEHAHRPAMEQRTVRAEQPQRDQQRGAGRLDEDHARHDELVRRNDAPRHQQRERRRAGREQAQRPRCGGQPLRQVPAVQRDQRADEEAGRKHVHVVQPLAGQQEHPAEQQEPGRRRRSGSPRQQEEQRERRRGQQLHLDRPGRPVQRGAPPRRVGDELPRQLLRRDPVGFVEPGGGEGEALRPEMQELQQRAERGAEHEQRIEPEAALDEMAEQRRGARPRLALERRGRARCRSERRRR